MLMSTQLLKCSNHHIRNNVSFFLLQSTMESELEKLHSKVGFHAQNEALLEEKLNSLQIGYDKLIKKEEVLGNKVRCIDDINGTLTRQEALLKERLNELEETKKTLVAQVKVLEEASSNTSAGNHMLVKKLDELDSRLQALEARAALSEALEKVKVVLYSFRQQI